MIFEIEKKSLKNILEIVQDVADECRIEADKEGIRIQMVGGANVCMLDAKLSNTSFSSYQCGSECVYGLDVYMLLKKIKKIPRQFGDMVSLDIGEQFTVMRCGRYAYKIETIDETKMRNKPRIPGLELTNEFIISSTNFANAIAMMDGKHVRISEKDEEITFVSTESKTTNEVVFTDEVTIQQSANSTSLYSIEYLKDMVKYMKRTTENIKFVFGQNTPCKISSVNSCFEFTYILAPRIESD